MTTYRENFRPYRDIIGLVRQDVIYADPTLVDPLNPVGVIDGEWMTLDSNGKLIRGVDITLTVGTAASQYTWPVWRELGAYDVQAQAEKKAPIIWLGQWEFETRIFDASATAGTNGLAITTMLQKVKVCSISLGGYFGTRTLAGLVGHGGSTDTDPAVGYVTRLPSANSGWLRIKGGVFY